MEELIDFSEVELAADGDGQLVWAAQGQPDGALGPGVRAWRRGTAMAVASPDVSGRDRLALTGELDDAVPLLRHVFDAVGTSYRVFGPAALVDGVIERVPGFGLVGSPYWMETTALARRSACQGASGVDVEWLDEAGEKAAAALFDDHFPRSFAQPGRSGVRRWAGAFDGAEPLAVAAEAWSGQGCGFMAGVVTHPAARGRGLAQAVCGFVVDALVGRYGRAALMVHADNPSAIAAYERLGMTKRLLTATSMVR